MRICHDLYVKINVHTQQGKWKIWSLKFAIYILDIFRWLVILRIYLFVIFYEIDLSDYIAYNEDK